MVYVKMVDTIVIGKSHGKEVVGRLTDDSTSLLGSLTKQKVFLSDGRRPRQLGGPFPFNMPWGYQFRIAKKLYSYSDDFS